MGSAAVLTFRPTYIEDLAIATAPGQSDTQNVLGAGPIALTRISLAGLAGSLVSAPNGDAQAFALGVRTGVLYLGPDGALCFKGPDVHVVGVGDGVTLSFSYTFPNGCYACQGYVAGAIQNPAVMSVVAGVATMTQASPPGAGAQIIFVRTA